MGCSLLPLMSGEFGHAFQKAHSLVRVAQLGNTVHGTPILGSLYKAATSLYYSHLVGSQCTHNISVVIDVCDSYSHLAKNVRPCKGDCMDLGGSTVHYVASTWCLPAQV